MTLSNDITIKYYFYLQILSKEHKKIKLSEGITSIGRSPVNDIELDDEFNLVSREHAIIKVTKDRCFYSDHPKNRNGSYILDPKQDKPTNTEDKWVRIRKNSFYPVTKDTIIRMGGPYSIKEEGKKVCDIKIIADAIPRKKTTLAHPKIQD